MADHQQQLNPSTNPSTSSEPSPYITGHHPTHIANHAWRTAENSAQYLLPTLRARVAANPYLRLLDCGAGPGTLTISLAKLLPEGEVVALDLSADVLARAAQAASDAGVRNVRTQVGSVYALPFPDESFDVVHVSQMLVHLPDPVGALRELWRVTRAGGGVLAAREADLRSCMVHPETDAMRAALGFVRGMIVMEGGRDDIAPRMVGLAMQAGVRREQIRATMGTWCYSTREEREVWGGSLGARVREGPTRMKAIERGAYTAEELDRIADGWEEWVAAEDGVFGIVNGEILATK